MTNITLSQLQELAQFSHAACLSLLIPTDPHNADPRINQTAFRKLADQALDRLKERDGGKETAETLKGLAAELLADEVFWKEQGESFLVLVGGKFAKTYKLPESQKEMLMVNGHFYILPLVPIVNSHCTFFILELDKEHTRMWKGSTTEPLQVVTVPELPKSVEEVTGLEMNERQLQFKTLGRGAGTQRQAASFHGSSSWKDDKDRYLERFLHAVDKAVMAFFKDKKYPLLLSGTEEPVVMYRKISKYGNIFSDDLKKAANPNHRKEQLQEQAAVYMESLLEEKRAAAVARFEEEPVAARKLSVLPEILRQAAQGKVETLLVAEGERCWGIFEPETLTTVIENEQMPFSSELLNIAAQLTLANGGEVFTPPIEQMPGEEKVAAVLRY